MGKKWVAVNEMVCVRIKNPNPANIVVPGKDVTFEPQGVLVSMGHKAVQALGNTLLNQTVRFTGQMQREVFGGEKDEFYFVMMPYEAIVAVLQEDEDDVATGH